MWESNAYCVYENVFDLNIEGEGGVSCWIRPQSRHASGRSGLYGVGVVSRSGGGALSGL